ncbi:site-specific DNA-methyltransferase [candidate division TA06 bacterium]|uniref:Methyltransferase n=1 Tax=candidate division TA06 bacterium TaxID=2250710 RepID=A0A933I7G6_UNCT6|nr:site-specific DNA-methyltransferase [candidate division TA06 bacterium]
MHKANSLTSTVNHQAPKVEPDCAVNIITARHKNEYFRHKDIVLINGDCLDKDLFNKPFIDLIVTSPPYNVGIEYNSNNDELSYDKYLDFSEKWMSNCFKWSNTQARFILNIPLDKNKGGQRSVGADLTTIAQKVGWKYHSTIIWNEGNISRRTAWGSWLSAAAPYVIAPVELILVLYKDDWKKTIGSKTTNITKEEFMEWTNGLWTFCGESKKRVGHPAPFPRELPKRAIKLFSFISDVVFDPFCGSGTTVIEASVNKRIGIGVELDKNYCKLTKNRIMKELGTSETLW